MAKGIDINKALEMLLSPYPRPGATILGLIDSSFEKFLPQSSWDATELAKRFTYDQWRIKLPERVRATPFAIAGSTTLPELQVAPVTMPPEPKAVASLAVTPSPKISPIPPTGLRIGGVISQVLPASAAPPSYTAPQVRGASPKPVSGPAAPSFAEPKARPLSDILGSFMRPSIPNAKPIAMPSMEEEQTANSEEPIMPTGISESTLSVIDKLRQRRAALAEISAKGTGEEEESKHTSVAQKPASIPRPTPAPAPTSLFATPKEWFDSKAKKSFCFTKFAFRLTPDEKKYKEYVVGVGEFAPKNFVLRSAVLEVKVRLMKDEMDAINLFWDWLKRGIIEEERQGGEGEDK
jgi:hypothetical protein